MKWPWQRRLKAPKREDVLVILSRLEFDAERFMEVAARRIAEREGRADA